MFWAELTRLKKKKKTRKKTPNTNHHNNNAICWKTFFPCYVEMNRKLITGKRVKKETKNTVIKENVKKEIALG